MTYGKLDIICILRERSTCIFAFGKHGLGMAHCLGRAGQQGPHSHNSLLEQHLACHVCDFSTPKETLSIVLVWCG
mgnify:CR=1 FL=1